MNTVELLVVYVSTAAEAWGVMGDEAGHFGDNGGDPDGPSYYRPTNQISDASIDAICNRHLGHVEIGEEVEYQRDDNGNYVAPTGGNVKGWCGYSSENRAYVTYRQ